MRILLPLLFLFLLLCPGPTYGQASADWQQRVTYDMDITLYADRHQMDGFQRLTYVNNSPDTLHQVFYHLYFNAFQPNSMMAERNRHLPDADSRVVPRIWNLGPDEIGYHRVESLTQNGTPVAHTITDTVLRVELAEPIPPGGEAVFEMAFTSQVPLQTRRSGRDNREGIDYSMSQWYPKMAAYDERGWHADPYIGREFYAPFGTFDVRITLPADYVVGGTGVLQNPDEIGHGYGSEPARSPATAADSLTWHFRAEDVHDFAWAADPDYLHDQITDDVLGITYHLLYQPDVAERWEPMRAWVPQIIQFYSERFGPYPWPQFSVIQAGDGGMEYPMVNFITGRRSPMSLLGVTAHEAAHEWFYGQMASNEADYAWMDEGFTSWATTEVMAHILGQPNPSHMNAFLNVVYLQEMGIMERFNTPSDWFETNTAYSIAAYPGGEMLVEMLGYVLSEERRDQWLREYYSRFQFRHPNPYDLEKIAEDVSGLRLDWYFEQFANTTRALDYAVENLASRRTGSEWTTTITLEREAPAVIPVDLRLTYTDATTQWVTIPLDVMQGHKPVPDDWIVAEPWRWTFPEYTLTLSLPKQVVKAEVDPLGLTPDVNRLNNASGFPMQARLLHPPQPSWFQYGVGYRPLAQFSDAYGVGVGAQVRGTYLFNRHEVQATLTLWPEVIADPGDESFADGIDYTLRYRHPADFLGENSALAASFEKHLGIVENRLDVEKSIQRGRFAEPHVHTFRAALIHQDRTSDRAFTGLPTLPFGWSVSPAASLRLAYGYTHNRLGVDASVELGALLDDLVSRAHDKIHLLTLHAWKTTSLGPLDGSARFTAGLGGNSLVPQKQFILGAATPEEQWRNEAYRSIAAAFEQPLDDAHFVPFSGTGPVGYLLNYAPFASLSGANLLAGTVSLSIQPLKQAEVELLHPLAMNAFVGVGAVWDDIDQLEGDDVLADAGLGVSYDLAALRALDRWTAQSDVLSGLHLVARFPLWVSDPERIDTDEDAFAFRWLVGVQVR